MSNNPIMIYPLGAVPHPCRPDWQCQHFDNDVKCAQCESPSPVCCDRVMLCPEQLNAYIISQGESAYTFFECPNPCTWNKFNEDASQRGCILPVIDILNQLEI